MGRYTAGGVGRDLLAGAIAGGVAVWVADKLDWSLYRSGGAERIRRTEAARPGGMDPAHVLANRAASAVGVDLGDPKDNPAGHTIHYGMGIGLGALYGLLRGISPAFATGRGGLFGLGAWVVQDEGLNTVLGTAGHPLAYPWQDHARGAAVHTLFGVATDLVARILSPWRDEVVIEQGPPLSERMDDLRQSARQGIGQARQRWDETMPQVRDTARAVAGQARQRWEDTAPRVQATARYAADQARRQWHETAPRVRDTARDTAEQARQRWAETAPRVRDTAHYAADQARQTARQSATQARRWWWS